MKLIRFACLSVVCSFGAFAGTISLQPSATTITLGNPLTVAVNVSGISDLFAWQFDITFNPAVLSAGSVTEGALFSGVGVFFSPGFIDNTAGAITFIGDSLSGPGPGISSDGTLATIQFDSIGAGSSSLDLANIILIDSNFADIVATPTGSSVTVTAGTSATPEPATIVLIVPALAVISFRLRSRRSSRRAGLHCG